MLTILAVGEDLDLLRTRADVLRMTGANVLCSSGGAALKFIAEWKFDLVALCHSVSQQNVERITRAAHQKGSKTLVLLLVSDRVREQAYDGINLDARSFVEPEYLIRSVTDLLGWQEKPSPLDMSRERQVNLPLVRKKPKSYPADIAARRALIEQFENRRAG